MVSSARTESLTCKREKGEPLYLNHIPLCLIDLRKIRQHGLHFSIYCERREGQDDQGFLRYSMSLVHQFAQEDTKLFRRHPNSQGQVRVGVFYSKVPPPRAWLKLSHKVLVQLSAGRRTYSRREHRIRMGSYQPSSRLDTGDGWRRATFCA